MSKKRHSKDKMYITQSEYSLDWGGYKKKKERAFAVLPFNYCSLSLQPFDNPVCCPEGHSFDIINIIPFLHKYHLHPVTGQPLKLTQLIKLHYSRNNQQQYHDPVSLKVFTEHSWIVAIRTSGNVYTWDTIHTLNKTNKYWRDLLNNQPFTAKDIITLQNPSQLQQRMLSQFYYIKNNIRFCPGKSKQQLQEQLQEIDFFKGKRLDENVVWNVTGKRIMHQLQEQEEQMDQLRKKQKQEQEHIFKQKEIENNKHKQGEFNSVQEFLTYVKENKWYYHSTQTTLKNTNQVMHLIHPDQDEQSMRLLDDWEVRAKIYQIQKQYKMRTRLTIYTNLGQIQLLLHNHLAPIACENFQELSIQKYYNETKFHRLVNNFIVQGGDPTGTGTGGISIFKHPFKDELVPQLNHQSIGVLGMANTGVDTNNSQFYITLAQATHLDQKHTVFGEVVAGLAVLQRINNVTTDHQQIPSQDIVINQILILNDACQQAIQELVQQKHQLDNKNQIDHLKKQREKVKWIDEGSEFNLEGYKEINKQEEKSLAHSLLYD